MNKGMMYGTQPQDMQPKADEMAAEFEAAMTPEQCKAMAEQDMPHRMHEAPPKK